MSNVTFPTRKAVDFVIIGSGAAGGVLARELSQAGLDVVVLEQGPYLKANNFKHDEYSVIFQNELLSGATKGDPQTFRRLESETAQIQDQPPPAFFARMVGGSSAHFTGNFWRFRPVDFKEKSLLGGISGTGFSDWPISYDDLEPYYTKVDWDIGVSGVPGPNEPHRSKPYPVPPLPVKSSGVLLEKGAKALGLNPQPAPMAILSQPHNGRPGCIHCGFCMGFGCEVNAKSSSLSTMIPQAEATGHCEIRPLSTVTRLETNDQGLVNEVVYRDADGNEQAQKAKVVIVAANGAETPRLLLLSESSKFPDGLANGSGKVGKYLMFNGHSSTHGLFTHPLNEYKSVQVTRIVMDFYNSDPKRGFYGGGGIDARPFLQAYPILYAMGGLPPDAPTWGAEYKQMLSDYYLRTMAVLGNSTSLAMESNNVSLDPEQKDQWGRAAMRLTYNDHQDDMAMAQFMQKKSVEILEAAGAEKVWTTPIVPQNIGAHLLGTCRMGTDADESVINPWHQTHEVPNLYLCDGSSLVTSGRGQPTMTIQALAFRAADHLIQSARAGTLKSA